MGEIMKDCKHKWKEDDKSRIRCLKCNRFQGCYNKQDLYEPKETPKEENVEEIREHNEDIKKEWKEKDEMIEEEKKYLKEMWGVK